MAIFYIINRIVAAETIEGGKLFKGGNYSREETIRGNTVNLMVNIVPPDLKMFRQACLVRPCFKSPVFTNF